MNVGMLQNKRPEDLGHSIAVGAMASERKFMVLGMLQYQVPGDLGHSIAMGAVDSERKRRTFGVLQNKVPEHLSHSIAKGAVQSGRKFNCEAPLCELKEPTSKRGAARRGRMHDLQWVTAARREPWSRC